MSAAGEDEHAVWMTTRHEHRADDGGNRLGSVTPRREVNFIVVPLDSRLGMTSLRDAATARLANA